MGVRRFNRFDGGAGVADGVIDARLQRERLAGGFGAPPRANIMRFYWLTPELPGARRATCAGDASARMNRGWRIASSVGRPADAIRDHRAGF